MAGCSSAFDEVRAAAILAAIQSALTQTINEAVAALKAAKIDVVPSRLTPSPSPACTASILPADFKWAPEAERRYANAASGTAGARARWCRTSRPPCSRTRASRHPAEHAVLQGGHALDRPGCREMAGDVRRRVPSRQKMGPPSGLAEARCQARAGQQRSRRSETTSGGPAAATRTRRKYPFQSYHDAEAGRGRRRAICWMTMHGGRGGDGQQLHAARLRLRQRRDVRATEPPGLPGVEGASVQPLLEHAELRAAATASRSSGRS